MGCQRPHGTHQPHSKGSPGKGTGQYRGNVQEWGGGPGSLHPPYSNGEGGTELRVKEPAEGPPAPHSSAGPTSRVGLAATATLSTGDKTGGEGAGASTRPWWHCGEYGTHTGDNLFHTVT